MSIELKDLKCGDIYRTDTGAVLVSTHNAKDTSRGRKENLGICLTYMCAFTKVYTEHDQGIIKNTLSESSCKYMGNVSENIKTFAKAILEDVQ